MALDPGSGDVFVYDGPSQELYKFSAGGEPVNFASLGSNAIEDVAGAGLGEDQIAIAPPGSPGGTAGDIYFAAYNAPGVTVFSAAGVKLGEFGPASSCGVTTDSSGHILVGQYPETVREFVPTGNAPFSATEGPDHSSAAVSGICNVAADSNGDIYAANYTGSAIYKLEGIADPTAETVFDEGATLAVDPGTQDVYVNRSTEFAQYQASGALVSSSGQGELRSSYGIAVVPSGTSIYAPNSNGKVAIFGAEETLPDATTEGASDLTETTALLNGTVNPEGTQTTYQFEWGISANYGNVVPATPAAVGSDSADHHVSAEISGLQPEGEYHFRLNAINSHGTTHGEDVLVKTSGALVVETTGSPERTANSVRFDSRVFVHGVPTTYHFEYGDQGPCNANPCTASPSQPAGSGYGIELVSQMVGGLQPGTTYYYRVVADDGTAKSPVSGSEMTVTTRVTEEPLSHGPLPGPPGSDRAWEQVNPPETDGNPVGALGGTNLAFHLSTNGERVIFPIRGGTEESDTGSNFSLIYSERTPAGWKVRQITPPRSEIKSGDWPQQTTTTPDLSTIFSANFEFGTADASIWDLSPERSPRKLFEIEPEPGPDHTGYGVNLGSSRDGSREVAALNGNVDPAFGDLGSNLYDLSSGRPHLVSILPNGTPCQSVPTEEQNSPPQSANWVSYDGSRIFFNCEQKLYLREMSAGKTIEVGGGCFGAPVWLIKSLGAEAYFSTEAQLSSEDTTPIGELGCGNRDIYRLSYASGEVSCVTCALGEKVEVVQDQAEPSATMALAENGSRVYFTNAKQLVPGAEARGIYRLNLATGNLAYVGPGEVLNGVETTPDGSTLVFSSSSPGYNAVGGQDNAGTPQAYRYDDNDRSLTCVSCPADGSAPSGAVQVQFFIGTAPLTSADGETVAFVTPTSLTPADQNTAGVGQPEQVGDDVYEWRDGRRLLVTDGLTESAYKELPNGEVETQRPTLAGVDPSGRDIFFYQPVQYTPDALDAVQRLYDARIGGGFEFPPPPKPCPLEVCQGTPKGTPEELAPGTAHFSGPGNQKHKKKHHKKKHHKKHHKHKKEHHKKSHRHTNHKKGRTAR